MSRARSIIVVFVLLIGLAIVAGYMLRGAGEDPAPPVAATPAATPSVQPTERAPGFQIPTPSRVRDRQRAAGETRDAPTAASAGEREDSEQREDSEELEDADPTWDGDPARASGLAAGDEADEDEATGVLDGASIQAGIGERLGEIRECYEGWLGRNPGLEGELLVQFTIGVDPEDEELGAVSEIDIADSTIDHVWMEGCVASVMQDVEFPPPEGGGTVDVTYPFRFSTE